MFCKKNVQSMNLINRKAKSETKNFKAIFRFQSIFRTEFIIHITYDEI